MARQISCRRAALAALVIVLVLAGVAAVGCGGSGGDGGSKGSGGSPEPPTVLSIEQALAAKSGEYVSVQGSLLATGAKPDQKAVLASGLAESYPPQAGQPTLPLEGLDLDAIVGLTTTAGQPGVATVTWSDFSLVLSGTMEDGVLKVEAVPQVFEAKTDDLRLRFSPVSEPIKAGETVWWGFDVKNSGSESISLTFSSGQRADLVLSQNGVEKYRWSDGKFFDQAIETIALGPGDVLPVVLNDGLQVEPGEYDFVATVTGSVGASATGETEGAALPDVTGRITVY